MLTFVTRAERAAAAADKGLFRSAKSLGIRPSLIRTSSDIVRSFPVARSRPHFGSNFLYTEHGYDVQSSYESRVRSTPSTDLVCAYGFVASSGNYAPCTALVSTLRHDRIVQCAYHGPFLLASLVSMIFTQSNG